MQDITFYYYCLHHKHIFTARTTFFFSQKGQTEQNCVKKRSKKAKYLKIWAKMYKI